MDRTAPRDPLTINRLTQRDVGAMIDRVVGNKPLPASIRRDIVERTDGVPLFVEEMTKAVLEVEFSHTLLASVLRKPEAELGAAISRLIQAGLLFRRGVPPDAIYLFKHALVQDAVYGTLLREPRRALHARIAQTIESQFAGAVATALLPSKSA